MNKCLNDVLSSSDPAGLIDPIELRQSDIRGVEFVPLCLLGLFNPMGPTLTALNLVIRNGSPSGAILYSSLNPFTQTRLIIARAPEDPAGVFELFKLLFRVGDGFILGCAPDIVIPSTDMDYFEQPLRAMLFGLISSVPSRKPLSKTNQEYREHWKDPWKRIPSMEEIMREALSGKSEEPVCRRPDQVEFDEWFSIVTDLGHVGAEFGAIVQAWGGSIEMSPGLPNMPIEEAGEELGALGFPYLKRE